MKYMMILIFGILLIILAIFLYIQQDQFGAIPEEKRLELVKVSPNYKDGKFRNIEEKPIITKGYSMLGQLSKMLLKHPNRVPIDSLPSIKTNLKNIPINDNVIVWFGHSSFFMQLDGVKFLVDPIFSNNASPLPNGIKAFKGSNIYTAEDMPEIDYMLLSHDHYDHLDYETAKALKNKIKFVICGLGAGAHYEKWEYLSEQIIEKDWGDTTQIKTDFNIYTEPTHHGSGRSLKSAQSLWLSFVIKSPNLNIYYSGDGGYSENIKQIAQKHPNIDWAIMECGQYNKAWQSVHHLPEEVVLSTTQLKAKNMLPVHHSKFPLAHHPWNEPLIKISELSQSKSYKLATPMIGELVKLNDNSQVFNKWWEHIK